MSNRFTGWVAQRMKIDGWIDPQEHDAIKARIKELEGESSSLEVQRKMANQVISDLQSQLHQRDTALVVCRKALDLYESGTFDKGWAAMNAIEQIDHALSQIQEVSNDK